MSSLIPPTNTTEEKYSGYYDEIGGTGKSVVADYLAITEPDKWFTTGAFGNGRDASQIILSALDSGWKGHGIIIDLPRQAESNVGFYQVIEDLKTVALLPRNTLGK